MRLVFHDCVRYTDGTGGCDGCLNWGGVGDPHPNPNDVMQSIFLLIYLNGIIHVPLV